MIRKACLFILLSGSLIFIEPGQAYEGDKKLIFESGAQPVPLLELYTSDVRSSCNAAAAYFNSLKQKDPGSDLWHRFVPVVMHVSNWDVPGYRDPFSRKDFAERLSAYKKLWGAKTMYAPTVAANAVEWSGWSRGQDVPRPPFTEAGELKVDGSVMDGFYLVTFKPSKELKSKNFTVHGALLGFNLKSKPSEGSNQFHLLEHDFVALQYQQRSLLFSKDIYKAKLEIPKAGSKAKEHGVAFWVTADEDVRAIQAVGGFLPSR